MSYTEYLIHCEARYRAPLETRALSKLRTASR